jgi:hypothetical protein
MSISLLEFLSMTPPLTPACSSTEHKCRNSNFRETLSRKTQKFIRLLIL